MRDHLDNMARRLEGDPFFLACPLMLYQKSEGLSEEALAARLQCSRETLTPVRLCRAPAGEAESFQEDVERIAARFSMNVDALAEAVRRGQALFHMASGPARSATLLAARDDEGKRGQRKGDYP